MPLKLFRPMNGFISMFVKFYLRDVKGWSNCYFFRIDTDISENPNVCFWISCPLLGTFQLGKVVEYVPLYFVGAL